MPDQRVYFEIPLSASLNPGIWRWFRGLAGFVEKP